MFLMGNFLFFSFSHIQNISGSDFVFLSMTERDINRVIEMAWEDRTPFDAIFFQFGLTEKEVIQLMRAELKLNSWKRWRKRVQGRNTKHVAKRDFLVGRHKCSRQRSISQNKVT